MYTDGGSSIRQIEEEDLGTPDSAKAISSPLDGLLLAVSKLTEEVQALNAAQYNLLAPASEHSPVRCLGCNQDGHVRRHTPPSLGQHLQLLRDGRQETSTAHSSSASYWLP